MNNRDKLINLSGEMLKYIGGFLHHSEGKNVETLFPDWKNFLNTKKVFQQLKKETLILEFFKDTSRGNFTPQSLVRDGILCNDIYRTATIGDREKALVKGYETALFPGVVPNDPWDGNGVLPDCGKALSNDDEKHSEQWNSLVTWHAELSLHLLLKPSQGILFDVEDLEFHKEFSVRRRENMKDETGFY
jgi:hypothetical protein